MAKIVNRKRKAQTNFRLRDQVVALLEKLAERTGKTKTRLVEEALELHAKTISK